MISCVLYFHVFFYVVLAVYGYGKSIVSCVYAEVGGYSLIAWRDFFNIGNGFVHLLFEQICSQWNYTLELHKVNVIQRYSRL